MIKHEIYLCRSHKAKGSLAAAVNTEENISSLDSEEDSAPDFDYLLKLPPSNGSHFLMKSEQLKYQQDADTSLSKYFSIDTTLLNLNLRSIPFIERHELNNLKWKSDELSHMQEESELYENKYRDMLKNIPSRLQSDKPKPPVNVNVEKEKKPNVSSPSKDSIQKWLDDILDV